MKKIESVAVLLIDCAYRVTVTDTCDDNVLFVCFFVGLLDYQTHLELDF